MAAVACRTGSRHRGGLELDLDSGVEKVAGALASNPGQTVSWRRVVMGAEGLLGRPWLWSWKAYLPAICSR